MERRGDDEPGSNASEAGSDHRHSSELGMLDTSYTEPRIT